MKLCRLQTTLGALALLLVTSSAFALTTDQITGILPNAGPKGGGQFVTIQGVALNTVTQITICGVVVPVPGPLVLGTNAGNNELYMITPNQPGNAGVGNVVLLPVNAGLEILPNGYTYLKAGLSQVNMVQIKISVKMKAATQITWDLSTPADDLGNAVAGTTNDFAWFPRDAQLSAARGILNTASYFVDAGLPYQINDADNFGPFIGGLLTQPNIQNVSTTGTTEKIFATARVTAGTWVLDTASNATMNHFILSAQTNVVGTFVPLSSSATTGQIHPGLTSGTVFPIVLKLLTPKTTNDTNAQLATVQITATQ